MALPTPPTIDLPLWAYGGGAVLTEPPSGQRSTGWTAVPGQNYGQIPPYQWQNWLNNSAGQWLNYTYTALQFVSSNYISTVNVQTFSFTGSPQSYVPSPNMLFCVVEAIAGGGGGGTALNNGTNISIGSGGGGGGYINAFATAAQIGVSQVVTVGAGGTSDNNGNSTSVGSIIATGGNGGNNFMAEFGNTVEIPGGDGGNGSSSLPHYYTVAGGPGFPAVLLPTIGWTGAGGTSFLCPQTKSSSFSRPSFSAGRNAVGYGGGGSGGAQYDSSPSSGGNGGNGFVKITEWCSG